jgi:hypothetical protein
MVDAKPSSRRDSGITALILGLFAIAWFSWGPPSPSAGLRIALSVGASAALAVALIGAFRACGSPRAGGALHDRAARRRYGLVVGIEFALAGLGAAALGPAGAADYIPVWVCAVVGLHFFALARVLAAPALRLLGAEVTTVAVAGLLVGALTATAPSSVTGPGTGLALLGFAMLVLTRPAERGLPAPRSA